MCTFKKELLALMIKHNVDSIYWTCDNRRTSLLAYGASNCPLKSSTKIGLRWFFSCSHFSPKSSLIVFATQ